MSKIERWFLKRLCRRLVKQGHEERIIAYYRIIHEAAEQEYTEDNIMTLNCFLSECYVFASGSEFLHRILKKYQTGRRGGVMEVKRCCASLLAEALDGDIPPSPFCQAGRDGDCIWKECPQIRDGEPLQSGRYCPLDTRSLQDQR